MLTVEKHNVGVKEQISLCARFVDKKEDGKHYVCSNAKLLLSELEVMFGIIRCHTYCLALNHLIILGKYFLYVNAINTIMYQFDDFVSLVSDKINLEKYLSHLQYREGIQEQMEIFLSL